MNYIPILNDSIECVLV